MSKAFTRRRAYQAVTRSVERREMPEALRYVVRALEERLRMSYDDGG